MKEDERNPSPVRKRILSVLVFLPLVLMVCPFGEGHILSLKGKGGFPYFDHQGNFRLVLINPKGSLSLATLAKEDDTQKISTQELTHGNNVHSAQVRKNKAGEMWILWEERESTRGEIYIAQLKNRKMTQLRQVTVDQKGFNFSPSADFSSSHDLWVSWINFFQKKYTLLVKNMMTGQTFEISSSASSSILSPQIIVDGTDSIWLFYVGQLRNRDEILSTRFDGQKWEAPRSLNREPDVPHLNPSLALDFNGFPHLVWSAYDGDDYELYHSCWDGTRWEEETRITKNQDLADTTPSLSLLMDTIPAVTWQRYENGWHNVFLTFRMGEEWIPEIHISRYKGIAYPLQLTSFGDRIALLWQSGTEIKIALLSFYEAYKFFLAEKEEVDFPRTLALDRDKHIGFGNSITLGTINNEDAPEKGYIPRLEKLIDENIKDSEVINRGVGGEKTAEGLGRISSVISEDQASTIFLMEGTNDVIDFGISMDTAAFNLKKMVESAVGLGMTVFLASIIPKDPFEGLLKERILALNEKIKSIVSELNVQFVDQFKAFGGTFAGPALYSDATHPNEAGYQLMAETFYAALATTLPSIEIDSTSLLFKATIGEPLPAAQKFKVKNSGQGTLSYQITASAPWIILSPTTGTSTGEWDEITVSVDVSNLGRGSYKGEVSVAADYTPNSPRVITIDLSISSPIIEVDKTTLSYEAIYGGTQPASQILQIRNSGKGTLKYQISPAEDWIEVSPQTGTSTGEWDTIQVSVDISSFIRGIHQGEITITGKNASNSPLIITVEVTILGPHIQTDLSSLSFEGVKGESNPKPQIFKVRNGGEQTLSYTITATKTWILVSTTSGVSEGEWDRIKVSVNISLLSAGNYEGKIRIQGEGASNSPRILTVKLAILSPTIKLNRTSLNFTAMAGGTNPPAKTFTIRNSGAGTLRYQITANRSWIDISPMSGTSTGERDQIQVRVDISSLSEETNEGEIMVRDDNTSNSPQKLKVTLNLQLPPLFPPLNFRGEKRTNRSLAQLEYINLLAWGENPENRFITKYRIYLIEAEGAALLSEVDVQTFEYLHRRVEKDKVYRYGLTAVDRYGRESEPTFVDVV